MSASDSPLDALKFDDRGLVCAVAQDATTGVLLMLAWANREAVAQTLATGQAHFYSRSRAKLWKKGEESGNVLHVQQVRIDCDGDAVLYLVNPAGPACHTGKPSCFFRPLVDGAWGDDNGPASVLLRLQDTIRARRSSTATKSYVRSLLEGGATKIGAKLREETDELIAELPPVARPPSASVPEPTDSLPTSSPALVEPSAPVAPSDQRVVAEAADLLFHLMVGLELADVGIEQVLAELARREGVSGHDEKAARVQPSK